eukprot:TRINITY_DN20457_c0_g1_i1.p1 TRINITY_DN20457_c0_g1~~TRINITY_DN20457_c0_g1_i1.p1  ORF type:complete len:659 (+),score=130.41 TRINITY_DN20457_c0_g1_i1:20-1996(+)
MTESETIRTCRDEGNAFYAAGKLQEADDKYTASLQVWVTHSPGSEAAQEAIKTLGNRAACRIAMEKYAEAEKDAEKLLRIQPAHARGLMLLGQASLKKNIQQNNAVNTPIWPFISACSLDERYTAEVLKTGVLKVLADARKEQVIRLKNDKELGYLPPPWGLQSDDSDNRSGRGIFAIRDIGIGEVILNQETPIAVGGDDPMQFCARCSATVTNSSNTCKSCKATFWCSGKCKKNDRPTHDTICSKMSSLKAKIAALKNSADNFGIPHKALQEQDLLCPVISEDKSHIDSDDLLATTTTCLNAYIRIGMQLNDESQREQIMKVAHLEAHPQCVDCSTMLCSRADVNFAAAMLTAQILENDFLDVGKTATWVPTTTDRTHLQHICLWLSALVQTNSFEGANTECDTITLVGPPFAWVNHSCLPNATRTDNGDLVACRPIKNGEEILTTYIADLMQPSVYRQGALRMLHTFECGCSRCSEKSNYALANAIRCPCGKAWVAVPEDGEASCSSCQLNLTFDYVSNLVEPVLKNVERIVPVLLGSLQSLKSVDTELLSELLEVRVDSETLLHPFHWLSHRMHAALINIYLFKGDKQAAASHSIMALAAMEATLQPNWVGKAPRANYVAQNYDLAEWVPTYIKAMYTKSSLQDLAESLTSLDLL